MMLNVVDLEMNQPSNAIIQIGAVQINMRTGFISHAFNAMVNSGEVLTPEIIALTGITQEVHDAGLSPVTALTNFWAWLGSRYVGAWGSDLWVLQKASEAAGVRYQCRLISIDLKAVAQIARCGFPKAKSRGGLKATMDLLGMTFGGTPHNALDDAWNTAMLAHRFVKIFKANVAHQEALDG